MKRRRRGFTLAELVVMALIFSIFSTTAVAGMTLALQYWRQANARMLAEQNARVSMETIVTELRQAIVDPDPVNGYQSISPSIPATGILSPNPNSTSGNSVVFTEPVSTYNPSVSGFTATTASNYQKVTYYTTPSPAVAGTPTSLHRTVVTYLAGGSVNTSTDTVICSSSAPGSLILSTQWESTNTVKITISAQEGQAKEGLYVFTLSANVPYV